MNTKAKATAAAVLLIAIIGISYAVITAQPPTVRTVPAAPQGEWVVIQGGTEHGNFRFSGPYVYSVLYHTGTGKARILMWPGDLNYIRTIESN